MQPEIEKALKDLRKACEIEDIKECVFVGFSNDLEKGTKSSCMTYCSDSNFDIMLGALLSIAELLAIRMDLTPGELYCKLYTDFGDAQCVSKVTSFKDADSFIGKANGKSLKPKDKDVTPMNELLNKLLGGKDGN